MIRYALRCRDGHDFDGWFRSSAAFEEQAQAGLVPCAVCGGAEVEKALMAPSVPASGPKAGTLLAGPAAALAELRKKIEANSDYVGPRFADEARAIHEGRAKARPVWGEATREEAKALKEEGIPAVPIPFMRRTDA